MAKTSEAQLARQRAWRAKNKEHISAYNKAYAKANPEKKREKDRRYAERHRAEIARKQRERMAAMDPDERRQMKREEAERNAERYRAYRKRHYAETAEEQKRRARQWVLNNPERRKAYREAYRPRARELYWANREQALSYMHLRRGVKSNPEHLAILAGDPCAYCGGPADTTEHIEPIFHGGDGEWENLAAACRSCNSAKRDKPLLHFLLKRLEWQTVNSSTSSTPSSAKVSAADSLPKPSCPPSKQGQSRHAFGTFQVETPRRKAGVKNSASTTPTLETSRRQSTATTTNG